MIRSVEVACSNIRECARIKGREASSAVLVNKDVVLIFLEC